MSAPNGAVNGEINLTIDASLLARLLFDYQNQPTDCEGLLFGTCQLQRRVAVDDNAERSVKEFEIHIVSAPILGARRTFYDKMFRVDVDRIRRAESRLSQSHGAGLRLLGFFGGQRVFDRQFVDAVFGRICKSLYDDVRFDPNAQLQFLWGGPIFLSLFDRNCRDDELKLDVGETKTQFYTFDGERRTLKPIRFKIANVGDTSHADYAAIESRDANVAAFFEPMRKTTTALADQLERCASELCQNTLRAVDEAIDAFAVPPLSNVPLLNGLSLNNVVGGCLGETTGVYHQTGDVGMCKSQDTFGSFDFCTELEESSRKRDKGEQNSSGNNSDELENGGGVAMGKTSHTTKRSRTVATTSSSVAASAAAIEVKPPKGRARPC